MFSYPTLTTVPFNGYRFYETPEGKYYPSITTVLGGTMPEEKAQALKNWQKALGALADTKTREAADHGTAVHLLIERYLKKEKLVQPGDNISNKNMVAFNALKLKLKNIEEVWGLEVAMYSDILELAGRCDCIGVYKGVPSIIDFKTSGKIKNSERVEDYRLQLTAYALMHNELFGTDIEQGVILMTSDGGFPQEFKVNLLEYVEPLVERIQLFYDRLEQKLGE